ncbi:MAG: hypothetical protein ACXIUV_05695 [Alkalilacustris sp.]
MLQVLPAVLVSIAIFAGFLSMSDRKRGTVLGQGVLVAGAIVFFAGIVAGGPLAGISPRALAIFAVGLLAAGSGGMLYHLYLGRFEEVMTARTVFVGVYLALAALYALIFLVLL